VSRALRLLLLLLLTLAACTNPLELGERRYREGDRLAALEIWRSVRSDSLYYQTTQRRVRDVEDELEQLVVLFKKRGAYYERKGRLAESVLNYRLALNLQPGDRTTLDRVQSLVRSLAARTEEARLAYAEAYEAGDLVAAMRHLAALATLDPFDPQLATDQRQLEDTLRREVKPLVAKGRRAFSSGNHRSAERAFRRVLQLDPENETAKGHLSFIAQIRDEEKAAAGTRPRGFDPPQVHATDMEIQAEGYFQNALGAERVGDLYKAIEYDIKALEANPSHRIASAHLSDLRSRLPSVEELIQAGRDHYQQEDLEAALDQWRNALLIDPDNAQALEYVARAERLLENLERLRDEPDVRVEAP
jgi:tetratricopeptide (TPR) repeat protein